MIAGVSPNPLVVNNLGLDFKQDQLQKFLVEKSKLMLRGDDSSWLEIISK